MLLIPEEAVLQRADGAVVFRLLDGNRVERLQVETGGYERGSVEVVNGLSAGDRVVSRGHRDLVDGELVVPRRPDGSPVSESLADVADGPDSGR